MKEKDFVTRYGDKIECIEGYYDLFSDLIAQYKDVIQIYDDFSQYLKERGQDREKGKTPPIQGAAYLARHARTAKMLEMLEKYRVSRRFDSVLDIGTGYGIMPRLMKAYGLVDKAFGLDLADRTYFMSSREILENESALAWTRRVDGLKTELNRLSPYPFERIDWAGRASYPEFGFAMNASNFFPRVATDRIDLDGLAISDIYEYERRHDLITSFCSLCCFDSEKLMRKVSSLLADGGIFFVYVNLWWYPINSTTLVGHFPYSHCRLDREDWTRYCREFHPEHFTEMNRLYDVIDAKHPTVSNYVETASRNGLTLLGYDRCIHNQAHDPRSRLSPNHLERCFGSSYLGEVLSNVRRFRPDVSIEDLQTSHVFLVFEKRGKGTGLHIDSEFARKSKEPLDLYGSYTSMKRVAPRRRRSGGLSASGILDSAVRLAARKLPRSAKDAIKRIVPARFLPR